METESTADRHQTIADSAAPALDAEIFKLLVSSVKDYAIFVLSMEGNIMTWNEGAQRLKGYTADDIVGKHFSIFYTQDSRDIGHPQEELRLAELEGRYAEEGWRVRKDGTTFWANVVITLMRDADGTNIGFAKVTRDLTERRKADLERNEATKAAETFKLMVEAVNDYAIFMLDPEGYVLTWNAGAQRIKGYTAEEIIGKHFSTFYTQESKDSRKPDTELKVAISEGRYEEEGWRLRKDGSAFWANVVLTPVRAGDGQLIGFAKITRDLTERKRIEQERERAAEELQQLNDELVTANAAKDVFLAHMSHELRTPLNSIMGFNDVMLLGLSGPMTETQTKQAGYIQRSAAHLLSLINDVLDLAKIESGNMDLILVAVDINEVLAEVISAVEPLAAEKEIYLRCWPNADPVPVMADERAIRQILTNLVSNAIKFTDTGGVTVTISMHGSAVSVSIQDTGIGIDKNDQHRLFKGFVQLARANRKQEGTGLGLALSKRLAELMNGDITVDSDADKGSTFALELPIGRG